MLCQDIKWYNIMSGMPQNDLILTLKRALTGLSALNR